MAQGSESSQQQLEGVRLAQLCGAEVTLAHVIRDVRTAVEVMSHNARWDLVAGDIDRFERTLRREADERLRQLIAGHCASGVTFHCETLLGTILTIKPAGFISPVQPAFWSLHPAEQPVQTGVS